MSKSFVRICSCLSYLKVFREEDVIVWALLLPIPGESTWISMLQMLQQEFWTSVSCYYIHRWVRFFCTDLCEGSTLSGVLFVTGVFIFLYCFMRATSDCNLFTILIRNITDEMIELDLWLFIVKFYFWWIFLPKHDSLIFHCSYLMSVTHDLKVASSFLTKVLVQWECWSVGLAPTLFISCYTDTEVFSYNGATSELLFSYFVDNAKYII